MVTVIANDSLVVERQVGLFAVGTDADTVVLDGGNDVDIFGFLSSGDGNAIQGLVSGNNDITVAATGALSSFSFAITLGGGGNTVTNAGQISSSNSTAIFLTGGTNTVTNSGVIRSGNQAALSLSGSDNLLVNEIGGFIDARSAVVVVTIVGDVTNHGTIRGGLCIQANSEASTIVNTGSVLSVGALAGSRAILTAAFDDVVTNTGTITTEGTIAIELGGGKDTYTGTGGTVIGEILGMGGDDTLIGGAGVEIFRGGNENDILDGAAGADTLDGGNGNDTYVLANEGNFVNTLTDAAGVDTITTTITRALTPFADIEGLTLMASGGAIWGYGNALANAMVGNNFNNRLEGLDNNDVLAGLGGCDTLAGGNNDDTFRFFATSDSAVGGLRDVITDLDDLGNDIIDLSLMAGVSSFIGAATFTAAGQVRATASGANVLIEINTVGTTGAESEILLLNTTLGNGAGQFGADDLIL